jgi:hypothetical protein
MTITKFDRFCKFVEANHTLESFAQKPEEEVTGADLMAAIGDFTGDELTEYGLI